MKIVVLESLSVGEDVSWDALSEFGEVELCRDLKQEDVKEKAKTADILVPNKLRIDASVLEGSPVQIVCEAATGYNNIDVAYCHAHNIKVANVSGYSTESVVQHTIALLLSLYEKLNYYDTFVKSGAYSATNTFSHFGRTFHELWGKRWGIVGFGNIGSRVAAVAQALGAEVVYHSVSGRQYEVPYEAVDFDTLLAKSDIITLHCPLNDKTEHMFDKNAFKKMKKNAVLVNVARGPIVKEKDLAEALINGEIAGAALDVFEKEPLPADSPLLAIKEEDRLLMTPHNAWGSIEARKRLIRELCENIRAFLHGEPRNLIHL